MKSNEAPRRCPRCALRPNLCFCKEIVPSSVRTKLTVVMHASEQERTSNTARWLQLVIPQTEIVIVGLPDKPFKGLPPEDPARPRFLLFPDPSARVLSENFAQQYPLGIDLIVPDGSWSQAKKLTQRAPTIYQIPRVRIATIGKSEYRLRKGTREGGVCTMEAVAAALQILEGGEISILLMRYLREFVERVLWGRSYERGYLQAN